MQFAPTIDGSFNILDEAIQIDSNRSFRTIADDDVIGISVDLSEIYEERQRRLTLEYVGKDDKVHTAYASRDIPRNGEADCPIVSYAHRVAPLAAKKVAKRLQTHGIVECKGYELKRESIMLASEGRTIFLSLGEVAAVQQHGGDTTIWSVNQPLPIAQAGAECNGLTLSHLLPMVIEPSEAPHELGWLIGVLDCVTRSKHTSDTKIPEGIVFAGFVILGTLAGLAFANLVVDVMFPALFRLTLYVVLGIALFATFIFKKMYFANVKKKRVEVRQRGIIIQEEAGPRVLGWKRMTQPRWKCAPLGTTAETMDVSVMVDQFSPLNVQWVGDKSNRRVSTFLLLKTGCLAHLREEVPQQC